MATVDYVRSEIRITGSEFCATSQGVVALDDDLTIPSLIISGNRIALPTGDWRSLVGSAGSGVLVRGIDRAMFFDEDTATGPQPAVLLDEMAAVRVMDGAIVYGVDEESDPDGDAIVVADFNGIVLASAASLFEPGDMPIQWIAAGGTENGDALVAVRGRFEGEWGVRLVEVKRGTHEMVVIRIPVEAEGMCSVLRSHSWYLAIEDRDSPRVLAWQEGSQLPLATSELQDISASLGNTVAGPGGFYVCSARDGDGLNITRIEPRVGAG